MIFTDNRSAFESNYKLSETYRQTIIQDILEVVQRFWACDTDIDCYLVLKDIKLARNENVNILGEELTGWHT